MVMENELISTWNNDTEIYLTTWTSTSLLLALMTYW